MEPRALDQEIANPFNDASEPAPAPTLYHCIPWAAEGTAIRTSTNYGTNIPQSVRDTLGMGEGHQPLVFAATHLSKALAFGMPKGAQGMLNTEVPNSDKELYLCADRDNTMKMQLNATVYAFSGKGFVPLPNAERQSVSLHEVPFAETKQVFHASSPQDLMRGGLQILAFRETLKELENGDHQTSFIERMMKETGLDLFACMGKMVRDGRLVWENQASGINPDPALAKALGVELGSRPAGPKAVAQSR
jgi:hypothetical protein